ncbi:hypothetical protein C8R43DRAFT_987447 [Mycena crocata]|nr:hypothetical protein C8R43DRAFT_987447 [Mycena crocata]
MGKAWAMHSLWVGSGSGHRPDLHALASVDLQGRLLSVQSISLSHPWPIFWVLYAFLCIIPSIIGESRIPRWGARKSVIFLLKNLPSSRFEAFSSGQTGEKEKIIVQNHAFTRNSKKEIRPVIETENTPPLLLRLVLVTPLLFSVGSALLMMLVHDTANVLISRLLTVGVFLAIRVRNWSANIVRLLARWACLRIRVRDVGIVGGVRDGSVLRSRLAVPCVVAGRSVPSGGGWAGHIARGEMGANNGRVFHGLRSVGSAFGMREHCG